MLKDIMGLNIHIMYVVFIHLCNVAMVMKIKYISVKMKGESHRQKDNKIINDKLMSFNVSMQIL